MKKLVIAFLFVSLLFAFLEQTSPVLSSAGKPIDGENHGTIAALTDDGEIIWRAETEELGRPLRFANGYIHNIDEVLPTDIKNQGELWLEITIDGLSTRLKYKGSSASTALRRETPAESGEITEELDEFELHIGQVGGITEMRSDVGIGTDAPDASLDIEGDMTFGTGVAVDKILDEDDFASNDETALATQQSIKAYVDSASGTDEAVFSVSSDTNRLGRFGHMMFVPTEGTEITESDPAHNDTIYIAIGGGSGSSGAVTTVQGGAGLSPDGATVGDVVLNARYDDGTIGVNGSDELYVKDNGITGVQILNESINNEDISPAAAIDWGKLNTTGSSLSDIDDTEITSATEGDILYYDGTDWVNLGAGAPGEVLTTYGDTAAPSWEAPSGGESGGAYIWDQDTMDQPADMRIEGTAAATFLKTDADADDPETPLRGMIRTKGSGSEFAGFLFDGTCWKKFFPGFDTTCYGGDFTVTITGDLTNCDGASIPLTASVSGGWPDFDYDWVGDGSWDDPATITVSPSVGVHQYIVQVRDIGMNVTADTVDLVVNPTPPAPSPSASPTEIDYGGSVTLSAGVSADAYSWREGSCGGTEVSTASNPTLSPEATTTYYLMVQQSGCWSSCGSVTVTVNVAEPFAYNMENGTYQTYLYGMDQADDGSFWACGIRYNGSYYDAILTKFDIEGNHLWTKSYGNSSQYDYFYDCVALSDGGVIVVGYTRGYGAAVGSNYSTWVNRMDSSGNITWSKAWGRSGYNSYAYDVSETADSNFVLIGRTYGYGPSVGTASIQLTKFSPTGTIFWHKGIGGTDYDYGSQVIPSETGGYVLTGYTRSFGPGSGSYYSMYLIKLDSSGNHVLSRGIGSSSYHDYGYGLTLAPDGYYLVGYTYSYGPSATSILSGFLVKLGFTGTLSAARGIGGSDYDYFRAIDYTEDGTLAIFGYTRSFGAGVPLDDNSMWVVELNTSYGVVNSQAMGCTGDNSSIGNNGMATTGGGYVVIGYTGCYGLSTNQNFIVGLDSDMTPCLSSDSSVPTVQTASPTVQSFTPTIVNYSPSVSSPSVPTLSTSFTWTDRCP